MNEYIFIFAIAFLFTLFAAIQDIKKREVANWINFSFIAFVLAYRAIYSTINYQYEFLLYGVLGFAIFFVLANGFYYSRVFAGGDAKLMMAFGTIIPFENFYDLVFLSIYFLFLLFVCGAAYSLIYSLILCLKEFSKMRSEFPKQFKKNLRMFALEIFIVIIVIIVLIIINANFMMYFYAVSFLMSLPFLYAYLKSVERVCMVKLVNPFDLTEGDWLEKEVTLNGRIIKKSVHGLGYKEIMLLRKADKRVLVKYGIPFVPAFLIALIIMVFSLVVLRFDFRYFLLSLF